MCWFQTLQIICFSLFDESCCSLCFWSPFGCESVKWDKVSSLIFMSEANSFFLVKSQLFSVQLNLKINCNKKCIISFSKPLHLDHHLLIFLSSVIFCFQVCIKMWASFVFHTLRFRGKWKKDKQLKLCQFKALGFYSANLFETVSPP